MTEFEPREPGRDDIEELLRRSLQSRAQDVQPDPATWNKVEAGMRRGRLLRWSLIGAAAAAVVLSAVVLPELFNGASVDLNPASPGGEGSGTAFTPCGGTEHISAVFARIGDPDKPGSSIWALCDDASQSLLDPAKPGDADDVNPALSQDGQSLVFQRETADGQSLLVHVNLRSGAEQILMGGQLPAFSPDGRLAWVMPVEQGQDRILIGRLFSEPEQEFPVVEGEDGEWFNARRLAWDSSGETLYAEIGYEGSIVIAYDVGAIERSGGRQPIKRRQLESPEQSWRYAGPGVAQSTGVAVVARCCAQVEGDRFKAAELRVLAPVDGGDEVRRAVRLPAEFDLDGTPWAEWTPAGPLRQNADGAYTWSGGGRPLYLVGDGRSVWAVQPDDSVTLIEQGVSVMTGNVALSADGPGRPPAGVAHEQDGLPHAVATTRQRVWQAAMARDFDALRVLMDSDFASSFGEQSGAGGAIAMLRRMEEQGEDPFALIIRLLKAPYGVVSPEQKPTYYFWPRPFVTAPEDWSDEDVAILRGMGVTDQELAQYREFGGYIGWRLGIDEHGAWTSLIAGD